MKFNDKEFSFPFYASLINDGKKHPFFVSLNFTPAIPELYMPIEEIIDNGFSVLSFGYKEISSDSNDFEDGLSKILYKNGERKDNQAGKIAMWAWAASRLMDYAETIPEYFDFNNSIVCGHSRLGITSLLSGAIDERFAFTYSNNSGTFGAAIARGKKGETIRQIYEVFPWQFCKNASKYMDKEYEMDFDQHYLLACIAPRKVLIGSASKDIWADPQAEMLSCIASSDAFEKPFIYQDKLPEPGDEYLEGHVGYQIREGAHYFSRNDWQKIFKFVNKHKN